MKAAVWTGGNEVRVQDVPSPGSPGPGEALVATTVATVCATDFHMFSGEIPGFAPPVVLGHEVSGVVSAAGDDVAHLKPCRLATRTVGIGQGMAQS